MIDERLLGAWRIEEIELDGKDSEVQVGTILVFSKEDHWWHWCDVQSVLFNWKADTSCSPHHITIFTSEDDVSRGIYSFSGFELHLCMADRGELRPDSFDKTGKTWGHSTLRRINDIPVREVATRNSSS